MSDFSYLDGIADGELRLQRCVACKELRLIPSPMCPACHSVEWDEVAASGRGTVFAWIVNNRAPSVPQPLLAVVELEEGQKLASGLVDVDKEAVRVGMPVRAVFVEEDSVRVLQFAPGEQG